jgi:hypothetical protein
MNGEQRSRMPDPARLCTYCEHMDADHRYEGDIYHECFVAGCRCGAYTVMLDLGAFK